MLQIQIINVHMDNEPLDHWVMHNNAIHDVKRWIADVEDIPEDEQRLFLMTGNGDLELADVLLCGHLPAMTDFAVPCLLLHVDCWQEDSLSSSGHAQPAQLAPGQAHLMPMRPKAKAAPKRRAVWRASELLEADCGNQAPDCSVHAQPAQLAPSRWGVYMACHNYSFPEPHNYMEALTTVRAASVRAEEEVPSQGGLAASEGERAPGTPQAPKSHEGIEERAPGTPEGERAPGTPEVPKSPEGIEERAKIRRDNTTDLESEHNGVSSMVASFPPAFWGIKD